MIKTRKSESETNRDFTNARRASATYLEEEFRLKKRKKLSIFNDLLYVFSCCRDTKFLSFQTNLIDSQFRLLKSANPIQCFRNYLLLRAVMENISGSNISEEFVTLVSS